jgi:F-type H+-transporting ATPase subunit b
MRKLTTVLALTFAASPAFAASGPFFSLTNTNFIVLLAFLLFLAILAYFKVPATIGKMLDKRSEDIRSELDEARKLREEAQSLLASYERKQAEVKDQADRIVEHAKSEAVLAAKQAKADMETSIARRLAAASEQIASAEAAAVKEVRDSAISVAIAAAQDVIAQQTTAESASKQIDDAIAVVGQKLH